MRIFPQEDNIKALKYYYFDYYLDPDQEIVKNTPLIIFQMKDHRQELLKENIPEARLGIEKFMGFPQPVFPDLVRIDPAALNLNIYQQEQTIKILFNKSFPFRSQVYKSAYIRIQGNF